MNSICAWCPACLTALGRVEDDHCAVHRSEIRAERPDVGFACHHNHEKQHPATNRATRRKKRK